MAKLDGKYIMVETESADFPITVTDQPVEKGINLIDHVQEGARTLSLSGMVAGPDAAKIRAYIVDARKKGKIVEYVGRNAFKGLITGFSTPTDHTTADGFTFTLDLREVRIATSSYVSTLPAPIKAQVVKIVNSGVKQTKDKKSAQKTKDSKKTKKTKKTTAKKKEKEKVQKVKFVAGSKWK